jgi:hypothetical protein
MQPKKRIRYATSNNLEQKKELFDEERIWKLGTTWNTKKESLERLALGIYQHRYDKTRSIQSGFFLIWLLEC